MASDEYLPEFEATWYALRAVPSGRHRLDPVAYAPTLELPAMTGRHHDTDGDGLADYGDVQVCDDRPRDEHGQLLDGQPVGEVEEGY